MVEVVDPIDALEVAVVEEVEVVVQEDRQEEGSWVMASLIFMRGCACATALSSEGTGVTATATAIPGQGIRSTEQHIAICPNTPLPIALSVHFRALP